MRYVPCVMCHAIGMPSCGLRKCTPLHHVMYILQGLVSDLKILKNFLEFFPVGQSLLNETIKKWSVNLNRQARCFAESNNVMQIYFHLKWYGCVPNE